MSDFFKSIRNIFLGNSKEDDLKYDPPEGEYLPELGDGFVNPLDSMPVANGSNRYAPPEKLAELESMNKKSEEKPWFSWEDTAPSEYEPPDEDWFDESDYIEKEKTMHQKMYEIATARNNPFHVGGSENAQSEIDYIKKHSPGGSENFQGGSENLLPPRPEEEIYDDINDPYGGH